MHGIGKPSRGRQPGVFYGWKIVWTGILGMILVYGIRHSFAVFFTPILEEFHWSRGNISIMMSLNIFAYGLMPPLRGSWRIGGEPGPDAPGNRHSGGGHRGVRLGGELWHFYLLFGILIPIGNALAGWPIIAPALMNWFVKRRGLVMGIGQMGGGLSFAYTML